MVDNTVTIIGNLTADPEVRVTDSGATLAEIRIAQNKRKRNNDGSWDEGEPTVSYTHLTLPTKA